MRQPERARFLARVVILFAQLFRHFEAGLYIILQELEKVVAPELGQNSGSLSTSAFGQPSETNEMRGAARASGFWGSVIAPACHATAAAARRTASAGRASAVANGARGTRPAAGLRARPVRLTSRAVAATFPRLSGSGRRRKGFERDPSNSSKQPVADIDARIDELRAVAEKNDLPALAEEIAKLEAEVGEGAVRPLRRRSPRGRRPRSPGCRAGRAIATTSRA